MQGGAGAHLSMTVATHADDHSMMSHHWLSFTQYKFWLLGLALLPIFAIVIFTIFRLRKFQTSDIILQAVRARVLLRARASGGAFCIGWILLVFGLISYILDTGLDVQPSRANNPDEGAQLLLFPPGLFFLLLALLPADELAISITCLLCCGLSLAFSAAMLHIGLSAVPIQPNSGMEPLFCGGAILILLDTCVVLGPMLRCGVSPRLRLRRLWLFVRIAFVVGGLWSSLEAVREVRAGIAFLPDVLVAISCFLAALVAASPARTRIFRTLASLGTSNTTELQSAAVVAYMITGHQSAQHLTKAESLFRVLPLESLTLEDIDAAQLQAPHQMDGAAQRAPHRVVARYRQSCPHSHKTRPGILGECDAFVTHSHRDDATAKLTKLLELQDELPGVDKTIWIDTAW